MTTKRRHAKAPPDRIKQKPLPEPTTPLPKIPLPKSAAVFTKPSATQSGRVGRPRIVPGTPKSPTGAATKSIYFKDADIVTELESIADAHVNASFASIIQQLAGMFLDAYSAKQGTSNVVEIPATKIYL